MNPSLYSLYQRIFSFFLRTATVYVEPLLQPWNKPTYKTLTDPITAVDLLCHWPGMSEGDLALLVEQELKRTQEPVIFARPYPRRHTQAVEKDWPPWVPPHVLMDNP